MFADSLTVSLLTRLRGGLGMATLCFLLAAGGGAWADGNTCTNPVEVTELAQGLFVRNGHDGQIFQDHGVANIGFVVGREAVAVLDTGGSLAEGRALACAIRQITPLPIRYVINTHVHPDHTLGNAAFRGAGVEFIGHAHLKRAMALLGPAYLQRAAASGDKQTAGVGLVFPDVEVATSLDIDLGGRRLELKALPQAHTDNDLLVVDHGTDSWWLADLLFVGHIPVIGGSGSVNGWLAVLEGLAKQPMARVIPGHGEPQAAWPAVLQPQVGYLEDMRRQVRDWIKADKGLAAAVREIGQAEAAHWRMADAYHKRNISYLYAELEWE